MPSAQYCTAVVDWPAAWSSEEADVLTLVNQARARGTSCGSLGSFGKTTPLAMDPALQCAANVHSLDMHERDFFDHVNPDGESPWDRIELAGYQWRQAGENIAFGASKAADVIDQWMSSPGHCANIMSPEFVHIGIGYHGDGRLWTQVFARP